MSSPTVCSSLADCVGELCLASATGMTSTGPSTASMVSSSAEGSWCAGVDPASWSSEFPEERRRVGVRISYTISWIHQAKPDHTVKEPILLETTLHLSFFLVLDWFGCKITYTLEATFLLSCYKV
ncbi:hypothetical protein AKJ16_DCAP19522 [Drosera capensis]